MAPPRALAAILARPSATAVSLGSARALRRATGAFAGPCGGAVMTDRQVMRLLPTCLAVWRRAGSPAHGIVFEVICRAWAIEDRRACPGSYEEAR